MERDEEMELAKRTVTPGDGEELLGGKPEDFFRTRGKHVFILSWSGRPIFSRYGDEAELSGFMGVVSALISNFQNLPGDEEPDQIRTVAAGKHKFVFLIRGPVYIVGVSEHPQESQKHIAAQLEYVYLQIVCVLTAGFAKVLECRPTFDLRKLMAGTENLLHSLMNDFSVNPAYLLDSVSCLRMPFQIRTLIGSLLKSAINETIMSDRVPPKSNSPLFALVLAGNKLVNIVRPKDRALHPTDLLLLVNFVCNLVSLRSSESCWTPVCLPKFNSTGYLYAHVSFLQQDISLVLLTAQQDGFYTLQEFKNAIYADFEKHNLVEEIAKAVSVEEISINDMDIGIPELQTVLYKSERLSQFFYSKASSLHETKNGERKLFRSIQHIHAQLHEGTLDQEIYLEKTSTETLFGWNSLGEFELYIVLSTFLSKERLIAAANRVVRWIRREESNLLVIGSPTW